MSDELADTVRAIIAEQAMVEAEELRDDTALAELGIDSLGLVEAIFAIEEAFDIQVPFNANEPAAGQLDLSTVGAVTDAVRRLVDGDAPAG